MYNTNEDDLFSTEEKWLFYALSRVLKDREAGRVSGAGALPCGAAASVSDVGDGQDA